MRDISNFNLSVQHSRGEFSHHTNGFKAPRPAHYVIMVYVLDILCTFLAIIVMRREKTMGWAHGTWM